MFATVPFELCVGESRTSDEQAAGTESDRLRQRTARRMSHRDGTRSTGRFRWIVPVCRYSELGAKPNSTSVHLWTSEHKSVKPWWESGSWNDPGVSRDAESGHGNGKRTGGDRGGRRSCGRSAWDGGRDRGRGPRGMEIPRVFSTEGSSPFDQVDWELRTAEIKDERGRVIFQQTDCEIPRAWSQLATNVVVEQVLLR